MKPALLCVVVSLLFASAASARIKPRFPARPFPPYHGALSIVGDDFKAPAKK